MDTYHMYVFRFKINNMFRISVLFSIALSISTSECSIFVDPGVPYNNGPLPVGELTATETTDKAPRHAKVYFPLTSGKEFATIYFLGGLNTLVLAEFYSIYLRKLASHGFYVFGVDNDYPVYKDRAKKEAPSSDLAQDLDIYFKELEFFKSYMVNRTTSTPRWDKLGLLCHSAGCDTTLKMILARKVNFTASGFLEPVSERIAQPVDYTIPSMMYGTEYAEEGLVKCNIKKYDYNQYYNSWKCPRIVVVVADFGHCEILDPIPWEACHVTHFCKTTNGSRLTEYRQFVQGATASFFITQLQGRPDAINYIADQSKSPLKLLEDKSDLNC